MVPSTKIITFKLFIIFGWLFFMFTIFPSRGQETSKPAEKEYIIINQDWGDWIAYKNNSDPWYFQENIVLVSACTIHFKNDQPEGEFFKQGDKYYLFLSGSGGAVYFESITEYRNDQYKILQTPGVSILAPVTFLPRGGKNRTQKSFFMKSLGEGWAMPAAKVMFEDLVKNHFYIVSKIDTNVLHKLSEKKVCSIEKLGPKEYQKRYEEIILDENFVDGIEIPFKGYQPEVKE